MIPGRRRVWIEIFILLSATLVALSVALSTSAQQKAKTENGLTAVDPVSASAAFRERVKDYVKLREKIEGKMPKLSTDAKPAEIEAHQEAFGNAVRSAMANAKPGDLFTADVASHIRQVIRDEFKGARLKELRGTVLNSDTKGVPMRIGYTYPETKEMIEMPPTLLLRLPELPKQMRYRFVGRNLLLLDRESLLIIDYMSNALP